MLTIVSGAKTGGIRGVDRGDQWCRQWGQRWEHAGGSGVQTGISEVQTKEPGRIRYADMRILGVDRGIRHIEMGIKSEDKRIRGVDGRIRGDGQK